jgi:hypothetical protein
VRYYTILIKEPGTDNVARKFTSFNGTRSDPGALDVELDIPVTFFATPFGAPFVRVWGIDLQTLSQAANFNQKTIEVYGGMQKGLPLAIAGQNGLLAAGIIQQAFGNWVGVNMTLDLVFTAGDKVASQPINLTINWRAGTPLAQALDDTLRTAFPGYSREINIDSRLVLPADQPGFYGTMYQFSSYVNEVSRGILRDATYRGVSILLKEKTFTITDGSRRTTPREILFTDLVGQITWLTSASVSIMTIMRADLQAGDFVKLPPGLTTTTAQSMSQARVENPFSGVFQITSVRHTGRFRLAEGTAWVTVFEAAGPF